MRSYTFSCRRRQSKWANAALVVGTDASDWAHLEEQHGVLAGVALQQAAERSEAASHDPHAVLTTHPGEMVPPCCRHQPVSFAGPRL